MSDAVRDAPQPEAIWRALADKAIGGDLGRLSHVSADGIPIAALSSRLGLDRGRSSQSGAWRSGAWSVAARIDHPDAGRANASALLDLEGGADALTIVASDNARARGFGLSHEHLDDALEGVELDFIGLRLDAGRGAPAAA